MGNVIHRNAAMNDIVRDGRLTLAAATWRGAALQAAAEAFLRGSLDLVDAIDVQTLTLNAAADTNRARRVAEELKLDDLVGRTRDELWNEVGRPANDALFIQMFPAGVSGYTDVPVSQKPTTVNVLASLIENTTHPLVTDERAASTATALRAAAAGLDAANLALAPIVAQLRVLKAQRSVASRQLQVQLARLKKHWKALGHSESDIHGIIPDRPITTRKAAAREADATDAASAPHLVGSDVLAVM